MLLSTACMQRACQHSGCACAPEYAGRWIPAWLSKALVPALHLALQQGAYAHACRERPADGKCLHRAYSVWLVRKALASLLSRFDCVLGQQPAAWLGRCNGWDVVSLLLPYSEPALPREQWLLLQSPGGLWGPGQVAHREWGSMLPHAMFRCWGTVQARQLDKQRDRKAWRPIAQATAGSERQRITPALTTERTPPMLKVSKAYARRLCLPVSLRRLLPWPSTSLTAACTARATQHSREAGPACALLRWGSFQDCAIGCACSPQGWRRPGTLPALQQSFCY